MSRIVFNGVIDALNEGADINTKYNDINNKSPLHLAVEKSDAKIVELLIDNQADIVYNNIFDGTPLHLAVKLNLLDIVKSFIYKKKEAINCKDDDDMTPLHYAVKTVKLGIVKFLIESDANVNCKNHRHETPLHYAVEENKLEIAQHLISNGANIESQSVFVYGTPLRMAVIEQKVDMVELLVKNGANINYKPILDGHELPLHMAIRNKDLKTVKILIKNGADLQHQDSEGNTYLLWAANLIPNNHNIDLANLVCIIKLLIESGVDTGVINQKDQRFNIDKMLISNEQKEDLKKTKPNREPVFQNLSSRLNFAIHGDLHSCKGIDLASNDLIKEGQNPDSHKTSLKNRLKAGIEKKLNELSNEPTIEDIKSSCLSALPISLHKATASALATHANAIYRS